MSSDEEYDIEEYHQNIIDEDKTTVLKIKRQDVLSDSIFELDNHNIKKAQIRIKFIGEISGDIGGLLKEWVSLISNEIMQSNTFKYVPSGNSLTINDYDVNSEILILAGRVLGMALNNNIIVSFKLSSFIWKYILERTITIEDMKDYDEDIYNSLKYIKENDVKSMDLTFVDLKNKPLCENGDKEKVDNKNKEKYIKLILERILINNKENYLKDIKKGFKDAVDILDLSLFKIEQIKNFIEANENIDISELLKNTVYNSKDDHYVKQFFDIISNWSQEQLSKLLKFITGISFCPVNGFKNCEDLGGAIKIKFIDTDKGSFPVSHVCFNQIEIPKYESISDFEDKLLTAIEVDDFGLS